MCHKRNGCSGSVFACSLAKPPKPSGLPMVLNCEEVMSLALSESIWARFSLRS